MTRKVKFFKSGRQNWELKRLKHRIDRFLKSKKKKRGQDNIFRVRKPKITMSASKHEVVVMIEYRRAL